MSLTSVRNSLHSLFRLDCYIVFLSSLSSILDSSTFCFFLPFTNPHYFSRSHYLKKARSLSGHRAKWMLTFHLTFFYWLRRCQLKEGSRLTPQLALLSRVMSVQVVSMMETIRTASRTKQTTTTTIVLFSIDDWNNGKKNSQRRSVLSSRLYWRPNFLLLSAIDRSGISVNP